MTVLGLIAIAMVIFSLGFWLTRRLQHVAERRRNLADLSSPQRDVLAPPDLDSQVQGLLAEGQIIDAIKLVRQRTGWDLRTSKIYVDRLRRLS